MTYLKDIEQELIKVKEWMWVPAVGAAVSCTFKEDDDKTIEGSATLTNWAVMLGSDCQPILHLYCEGALITSLVLNYGGVWKGRDRKSRGFCQISSIYIDSKKWKILQSESAWKTHAVKRDLDLKSEDEFLFSEASGARVDYEAHDYNLADECKKEGTTAICLIAYNRLEYFKEVLHSIGQNKIAKKMPVYLFVDKAEDDPFDVAKKQVEECRKVFPQTVAIVRPINYGCGRNIIDARYQLFNNLKYDKVFVFEDDCVIASNYMRYCLNLWDWSQKEYSNVGAVQGWNKCLLSKSGKKSRLGRVNATYSNWWAYLQGRESWMAMQDSVLTYQKLFLTSSYEMRPHRTIHRWFNKMRSIAPKTVGNSPFPKGDSVWSENRRYFDNAPPTGQDAITMHAFEQEGYIRLAGEVNRAKYIGENGIHMNSQMFIHDGFPQMTFERYASDTKRKKFTVSGKDQHEVVESTVENLLDSENKLKGIVEVNL